MVKDLLIISSARSGSHFYGKICEQNTRLKYTGELLEISDFNGIASIVQPLLKYRLLTSQKHILENKEIHILRRRDKVEQFRSWILFDLTGKHSGAVYDQTLPSITISENQLDQFIAEQILDYSFISDKIVYYEDLLESHNVTSLKKNIYNIDMKTFVTNWDDVEYELGLFKYNE